MSTEQTHSPMTGFLDAYDNAEGESLSPWDYGFKVLMTLDEYNTIIKNTGEDDSTLTPDEQAWVAVYMAVINGGFPDPDIDFRVGYIKEFYKQYKKAAADV